MTGVAVIDFVFQLDTFPARPEKYRAKDAATVGGGCAANAAVAIARLGGTAHLAARVGADPIGDMIVSDLEREGVECSLIRRLDGIRSSFSSIFVDAAGDRQIVNYLDPHLPVSAEWLEAVSLPSIDAVLADTRWPEGGRVMMAAARAAGIPGIMDAEAPLDGADAALELASHVAFSAQGLRAWTARDDLAEGLRVAAARLDAWLCVTDGEHGVLIGTPDGPRHVPAFPVEAVDTLGAGDVWHGAFALRLGEGADAETAVRFANAVAALKCTRFGGRRGTPSRRAVEDFMKEEASCT